MKFDEAKKKMSPIHKLHTARDVDGETIFYRKPYTAKKIEIISNGEHEICELDKVTHLSLSECGLLIQYVSVNKRKWLPFPLKRIDDIIVIQEVE